MEAVILEYFHLFRNTGMITEQDIRELEELRISAEHWISWGAD